MRHLDEFEELRILRNVSEIHIDKGLDNRMPVMNLVNEEDIDFENMIAINIQNLNAKTFNHNHLVLPFRYDVALMRYWNNPFSYVPLLSAVMAVCTPDFSVYPGMYSIELEYNVFRNRWLGCWWQDMGCTVIPTITWALADSYDVCFSGVKQKSVVAISTLGCLGEYSRQQFLRGFNEMKKRLSPSVILVYGNMVKGMTGKFVNVKYKESFGCKKRLEQLKLFSCSRKFELKEGV